MFFLFVVKRIKKKAFVFSLTKGPFVCQFRLNHFFFIFIAFVEETQNDAPFCWILLLPVFLAQNMTD
jgi:hypothetical protein